MATTTPKLLFLALPFPPLPVGSIRTWSIAQYLIKLGWDVTVVTPHPSVWRNVENVESVDARARLDGIQRIFTDHSWRCLAPEFLSCRNEGIHWAAGGFCRRIAGRLSIDKWVGWAKAAEKACAQLTPRDVDVILATGSPFTSFSIAKQLSDRLGRPYVLDYRDPWTENPHAMFKAPRRVVRRERLLLETCSAATIVSPSWAKAMDHAFGVGSKLHVIPNGYDPNELDRVQPIDFDHFAVVYTGTFYPPKRVIAPIMAALRTLKVSMGSSSPWRFHYFGTEEAYVRDEATRFGVLEHVVLHGRVPREKVHAAVRGADLAVVITSVSPEASPADRGVIPGKIFEALGLQTPVLLISPSGSDAGDIILRTKGGAVFHGEQTNEISQFLSKMISGQLQFNESATVQEWAWPTLIRRFDQVLRKAIGEPVDDDVRDCVASTKEGTLG